MSADYHPRLRYAMLLFVLLYVALNLTVGSVSDLQPLGQRLYGGTLGVWTLCVFAFASKGHPR